MLDNWLHGISVLARRHEDLIVSLPTKAEQVDALCEINVIEQVRQVCTTSIIQHAWRRGQDLSVHGWIYGIQNGLLHDLHVTVSEPDAVGRTLEGALTAPRLAHKRG